MSTQFWQEHSLQAAPQDEFGTAQTDDGAFRAFACEKPKVQFATDVQSKKLLKRQIGAVSELIVGARSGTLSFTMPLECLPEGFNGLTDDLHDNDAIPPWFALVSNALSGPGAWSNLAARFWSAWAAHKSAPAEELVVSATNSAVTRDGASDGAVKVGQLLVAADSPTSPSAQLGFVKTKTGAVLDLIQTSRNVCPNGGSLFPTKTAFVTDDILSPQPLTFRWSGEHDNTCYVLQDAYCSGFKISIPSGQVPEIEFTFSFYDFYVDQTKGGLVDPKEYSRTPQLVGQLNGYAIFAQAVTDGIEALTVEYKSTLKPIKSHNADQGVGAVLVTDPQINLSLSVPYRSDDEILDTTGTPAAQGQHNWQSALERGQSGDLGVYVASQPGRAFAVLIPAARLTAAPQVEDRDGLIAYTLQCAAGTYGADTGAGESSPSSPINSIFRIALG